jgi:hypothetical protein
MTDTAEPKHLVLAIEVPAFYTEDIDVEQERREYFDASTSDSEIVLGHMGQPNIVRLTMEVSGEKDSEIIDVLDDVREASLQPPTPGVTDDDLQEHAWKLQVDQDEAIESAVRRLRREDVPLSEIIDLLEGEVEDLRRRISKEGAAA